MSMQAAVARLPALSGTRLAMGSGDGTLRSSLAKILVHRDWVLFGLQADRRKMS